MCAYDGEPRCHYCGVPASLDPDCLAVVREEPEYYPGGAASVAREDGTYSAKLNAYACTSCYLRLGAPSSPQGWRAGDPLGVS